MKTKATKTAARIKSLPAPAHPLTAVVEFRPVIKIEIFTAGHAIQDLVFEHGMAKIDGDKIVIPGVRFFVAKGETVKTKGRRSAKPQGVTP